MNYVLECLLRLGMNGTATDEMVLQCVVFYDEKKHH
jgi:hypothetical protein